MGKYEYPPSVILSSYQKMHLVQISIIFLIPILAEATPTCAKFAIDFNRGHNIASRGGFRSWEQCGGACKARDGCNAWTWVGSSETCYMKASAGPKNTWKTYHDSANIYNYVSGIKDCPY